VFDKTRSTMGVFAEVDLKNASPSPTRLLRWPVTGRRGRSRSCGAVKAAIGAEPKVNRFWRGTPDDSTCSMRAD